MRRRHRDSKRRRSPDSTGESSSSGDGDSPERRQSGSSSSRRRRHHRREEKHRNRHHRSRKDSESESESDSESERRERSRQRRRKEKRRSRNSKSGNDSDDGDSDSDSDSEAPAGIVRILTERFPDDASDLKQLLEMIDNGQGVDVRGISNKSLVKLLKRLFRSLKLKRDNGIYLLPTGRIRTMDIVGPAISSLSKPQDNQLSDIPSLVGHQRSEEDNESLRSKNNADTAQVVDRPSSPPRRRIIGPAMPSRELLAAAAELTEAESLLREADMEVDNDKDLFIGPPPPAVVAEAESANEAERFEEVERIAIADPDKPYDVLGVNWKMSAENIKKKYWKLSLMVHPDKCSHPQAHQAFVTLNKSFKDLQDPDKRRKIDEQIERREAEEALKVELKSQVEAAQWRKLQGISLEGDEELLAFAVPKEAQKRDEWMTTLPPERKPGMSMHSTTFSRTGKEGRGDTSIWTDSPLDKAAKAKQNYLEAYDRAKALADADEEKKGKSRVADLVDKYNTSKRGKSLVEKHEEEKKKQKMKEKKEKRQKEKEEWEGQHPWRPWDREKDLTAGRQKVNLSEETMVQGLANRFSSGSVQRNFL